MYPTKKIDSLSIQDGYVCITQAITQLDRTEREPTWAECTNTLYCYHKNSTPQVTAVHLCLERHHALLFLTCRGDGTMWPHCFQLLRWDNMTSAKALWTSKSTFISMTLNSLPIKDKSPFHMRSSICQCHHTKERGNLFMLNMPPISTFGCPLEHCFLIKRGSLSSSLFLNRHVSLIPLYSAWNSHDNISFNYSFLWLPSSRHSTLLSSSSLPVPAKRKSDTWACIEIALIFTHHTLAGAMAFIWLGEHTLPEKLWGGGGRGGEGLGDEWNGAKCARTELTRLPSSYTAAASLFTLTGGRLRAKISSHFLTEGQGDTVLRMNGHVMLSML